MKMGSDKIQQKPKKPKFQKEGEEEFQEEFQAYLGGGSGEEVDTFSQKIKFETNDTNEDTDSGDEPVRPLEDEEYDSD
jgi:hypothetical protein